MLNDNKKSFVKGIIAGIIGSLIIATAANGVNVMIRSVTSQSAETPASSNTKLSKIMSILDKYYVDDVPMDEIEQSMYEGLVSGIGDPYTVYMDQDEYKAFTEDTEGKYAGVGIVVSVDTKDNRIIVVSPFEGSPGEAAGIQSGDKIMKVNGTEVAGTTGIDLDKAIGMMKGPAGTDVTITLYRESEERTFDVLVTRDNITIQTVSHKMLDNQIGYLRISQFDMVTYDQFKKAYDDLNKQGQKGMIVDLRNNPGGIYSIVCKIADTLLPEGTIVYTIDKSGHKDVDTSNASHFDAPLVLLVNGGSASASEILAGAVKDMNAGLLVGTQTFGKGLVQRIVPVGDGSAVKVTVQRYYTPSGVCIQGTGIEPDVIVEFPEGTKIETDEDDIQLQKAMDEILKQLQ